MNRGSQEGGDGLQRRVVTIPRTAGGLAIEGNYPGHDLNETPDPLAETDFEHLGIEPTEHPAKGVMGRCVVRKHQVALEPGFVVLGPFGYIDSAVFAMSRLNTHSRMVRSRSSTSAPPQLARSQQPRGKHDRRGTNENNNGLIRQYFPQGTDFITITQQEISRVMKRLNNRPINIPST